MRCCSTARTGAVKGRRWQNQGIHQVAPASYTQLCLHPTHLPEGIKEAWLQPRPWALPSPFSLVHTLPSEKPLHTRGRQGWKGEERAYSSFPRETHSWAGCSFEVVFAYSVGSRPSPARNPTFYKKALNQNQNQNVLGETNAGRKDPERNGKCTEIK